MLWSLDHLRGYKLDATDGSLGSVEDAFFDDRSWMVRWLAADTAWLFGRRVLLAPASLRHPNATTHELPVGLTKEKIKAAPAVDLDQPVSRQHEAELVGYYGFAPYWGGLAAPIPPIAPYPATGVAAPGDVLPGEVERGDPYLRSGNEVTGYTIRATDDSVGHVEDLLIDDSDWTIRYLVVDTRNWLPGRKVLIAPTWVREISWDDREVSVVLTREQIERSPEYDPEVPVGREYEEGLYGHYRSPGYWT